MAFPPVKELVSLSDLLFLHTKVIRLCVCATIFKLKENPLYYHDTHTHTHTQSISTDSVLHQFRRAHDQVNPVQNDILRSLWLNTTVCIVQKLFFFVVYKNPLYYRKSFY